MQGIPFEVHEYNEDEMNGFIIRRCAERGIHLKYVEMIAVLEALRYWHRRCQQDE